MKSGSSAPIHSAVQVERWVFISSSSQKSRPFTIGTAVSVRRATSTDSTMGIP